MAENSRQSKLSEKGDECIFTWKLFTGWDYMIGNSETAHNRTASIILGFKEALLEEAEKKRDEGRNWKVTGLRVFAHLNVVWLLGSSVYAVILVVDRSTQPEAEHGWWRRNEITIVVSLITSLFPMFFEGLGYIEQYHPRKKLRMQLGRIMILNLMNLYTLIFASFSKINEMSTTLQSLRPDNGSLHYDKCPTAAPSIIAPVISNETSKTNSFRDPSSDSIFNVHQTLEECKNITVPCPTTPTIGLVSITLSVLANFTLPSPNSTGLSFPITSSPLTNLSIDVQTLKEPTILNNYSEMTETIISNVTTSFESSTSLNEVYLPINNFLDLSEQVIDTPEDKFEFINIDHDTPMDYNGTSTAEFSMGARESENMTTVYPNTMSSTHTSYIDGTQTSNYSDSKNSNLTYINYSGSTLPNDESSTKLFDLPQTSTLSSASEEICVELVCESKPITNIYSPKIDFTNNNNVQPTTSNLPAGAQGREVIKYKDLTKYIETLDEDTRKRLRPLCWETMFGREMVKLTVMDLVMTVMSILMVDFFRAVFVRAMNNCWCWDLEKEFPKYGDFKIAENILHLVNNQGMVWMGMFFSPGLPLINIIKLAIMMYLRSWAVLTCNVPHEVVFRASRSNNFYLALLLTMLFLCVLPVGYAVVWVVPSWHCGPFSNYRRIYYIFTTSLREALPYKKVHLAFDYMASPGIVIPLLMLLVLIIYYLVSLTSALREANNDLKIQLRQERTEERRKMFQLVNRKQKEVQEVQHSVKKWRKIMPNSYHKPSIADIPIDILKSKVISSINGSAKHRDIVEEIIKTSKRMPSGTSEEDNYFLIDPEDVTDIEQHDSLPYDGFKDSKPLDLYPEIRNKPDKLLKNYEKELKARKNNGHGKNKIYSKNNTDYITSGWSDIPEIRIIQTGSTDKINEINGDTNLSNMTSTLDKKYKHRDPPRKSSKQNGQQEFEREEKKEKEEQQSPVKKTSKEVKEKKKRVQISIAKAKDNTPFTEMNTLVLSDNQPGNNTGTNSTEHSDGDVVTLDSHCVVNSDCIKTKQSTSQNNDAQSQQQSSSKSTRKHKSSKISKSAFNPKQQSTNEENVTKPSKAVKNCLSGVLGNTTLRSNVVQEQKTKAVRMEQNSSDSEEENKTIIGNNECSETEEDKLSVYMESDYDGGTYEQSGSENDDGSNSDDRDEPIQRQLVQKKQTNLKEMDTSDSDNSDISSLSTVKQINNDLKKNKREAKVKRREVGIHTGEDKKTVARFKIAKALLNEARRRSSAGFEDK